MEYLFWGWYGIGLSLMLLYEVPDFLHFSNGLFLVFFALYAMSLEKQELKNSRSYTRSTMWVRALIVAVSTYVLEWIGTETGYPFGTYVYTGTLSIFGEHVPVAIGFAWIGVMVMSVLMSTAGSKWLRAIQAGGWAMLFDLVLDPAAYAREFWIWSGGGFYSGIPTQNFVSWFAAAFVLSFLFPLYNQGKTVSKPVIRLYQGMLIMFGLLAAKEGLYIPLLIAIVGICIAEGVYRFAGSPQKQSI
ncbi:carotenoid biosynthesis protein [Paenibacillus lemnae]|uniref:Carotenoid biosynthesis protein n=1 Tax=Paenibacillus lemnae TaxID=1330551 RepID=A0A848MC90_PAELE|nr:carotenoid biosynthesis protein [Paenibacillus lemnae]